MGIDRAKMKKLIECTLFDSDGDARIYTARNYDIRRSRYRRLDDVVRCKNRHGGGGEGIPFSEE